jgi:hypothetical protein
VRLRHLFTDRAINTLLLRVLVILIGSGTLSLFANEGGTAPLFEAHRLADAAFLLLLIPKAGLSGARCGGGGRPGGNARTLPSH